jgi:hypothetical protein
MVRIIIFNEMTFMHMCVFFFFQFCDVDRVTIILMHISHTFALESTLIFPKEKTMFNN